ncbi:class I SAM-dependent methyltransferase [Marmoricola sp. RAF53]|uniref:class I SAM-dependent methyltransferase n=1 Tax=Marmoricola sp. RAF53 TaxID=3233059 RepID=UPI003F9C1B56
MTEVPETRWEQWGQSGYKDEFTRLIETGADVEGEARLADVLVGRGSRILDAGAGIGRIGGALAARGHDVLAVEKDPDLIERAAHLFPDLPMLASDLLALSRDRLAEAGHRADFDLIVLVGNVIVFAAPDTEQQMLATLRDLLAPGGRILVGFHPRRMHGNARDYPFEEFARDVDAAGLRVQHRFGTYELHPPADDYCVAVLAVTGSR